MLGSANGKEALTNLIPKYAWEENQTDVAELDTSQSQPIPRDLHVLSPIPLELTGHPGKVPFSHFFSNSF